MRYVLLGMSMVSDIMLVLAAGAVWYHSIVYGNGFGFIFAAILTLSAFRVWKDTGGLSMWKRSEIKQYLVNAKRYGL